jgi:hypothetical protein
MARRPVRLLTEEDADAALRTAAGTYIEWIKDIQTGANQTPNMLAYFDAMDVVVAHFCAVNDWRDSQGNIATHSRHLVTDKAAFIHRAIAQKAVLIMVQRALSMRHPRRLPATRKVELLREMGFSPVAADHDGDCPAPHVPQTPCQCVPPATVWAQPGDVDELLGQTLQQRLAKAGEVTR